MDGMTASSFPENIVDLHAIEAELVACGCHRFPAWDARHEFQSRSRAMSMGEERSRLAEEVELNQTDMISVPRLVVYV
jgi:hypothetical protein